MKKLLKYWYVFLVLAIIIGVVVWIKRPKSVVYTTTAVSIQPIQATLSVSGTLQAEKSAALTFQTGGDLAWVGVKEGDLVKKGQAIASLDQRSLEKGLKKELNDYMKIRWDYENTRDAYFISTQDSLDKYSLTTPARRIVEKAGFDLGNSVLDVEIQSIAKEYATLTTPFSGLVTDVAMPNSGVNVFSTTAIATVVDPETMYFKADVDELDIKQIAEGQRVELEFDAYPEEIVHTTIVQIGFAPITLSGGGTGYEIKIALPEDNSNFKYKLGMNGKALIEIASKSDALVVPSEAVFGKNGDSFVKVLTGKTALERKVKTGIETDTQIEILDGLGEGETVVTSEKK